MRFQSCSVLFILFICHLLSLIAEKWYTWVSSGFIVLQSPDFFAQTRIWLLKFISIFSVFYVMFNGQVYDLVQFSSYSSLLLVCFSQTRIWLLFSFICKSQPSFPRTSFSLLISLVKQESGWCSLQSCLSLVRNLWNVSDKWHIIICDGQVQTRIWILIAHISFSPEIYDEVWHFACNLNPVCSHSII